MEDDDRDDPVLLVPGARFGGSWPRKLGDRGIGTCGAGAAYIGLLGRISDSGEAIFGSPDPVELPLDTESRRSSVLIFVITSLLAFSSTGILRYVKLPNSSTDVSLFRLSRRGRSEPLPLASEACRDRTAIASSGLESVESAVKPLSRLSSSAVAGSDVIEGTDGSDDDTGSAEGVEAP